MVGNGIYLGPCTMRQYCAIILFIYCIFNLTIVQKNFRLIPQYLFFVALYGVSCLHDNLFPYYIRSLISLYLVSLVGYFVTIIILSKYRTLNYFCNSFIVVGLVNALINILQYSGVEISYIIGEIFVDMSDEVKLLQFTSITEGNSGYTIGIMGDIVYNGYYSMILPFILMLRLKSWNRIVLFTLVIISLFSLFVIGERSCFGITVVLLTYYIYKEYKKSVLLYLTIFLVIIALGWFASDLLNSDMIQNSRWVGHDSGIRDEINSSIVPYIINHLFIGGLHGFIILTGSLPHNVIASGFIYAGILGGLIILYMLFYQAKVSLTLFKNNLDGLMVLAFVSYTLNGLFHNPAIVTGDAMIWILWGMVYYQYKQNIYYLSKK